MKNIIITGTSSGIGLELVKIYSKSGYKVISLSVQSYFKNYCLKRYVQPSIVFKNFST